jgi:putative ABC transport system permease protein
LRWSWRDLRQRWVQVAAIAAIIALGSGLYSGLVSTGAWRRMSYDASYAALQMYDVHVELSGGSFVRAGELRDAIRAIESVGELKNVEERLVVKTQVDASTPDETILVPGRLVGVPVAGGGPSTSRISAERGRTLRANDAGKARAVLDYHFAEHYGLPSRGRVVVSGDHPLRYVGQGLSPEYFFIRGDQGSLLAESSFAVVFVPLSTAQSIAGRSGLVNDAVVAVEHRGRRAAVAAEIRRVLRARLPGVGFDLTLRNDDDGLRVLYDDIDGDQKLYTVLALLTLAGAAFAAFNLAGRMVEAQRREIGIGMALGTPPPRLAVRPLLVGAQIAALGAALGIGVGWLVGQLMSGVLESFFPLPVWRFPFQTDTYLQGAALGLVVPFVATAWPVWRAVRVTPLDAIRTGAFAPTRVSALSRIRLPGRSLEQMPFRNVLRTPRRSILTALAVAAAITVLVGVVGMIDSFTATIQRTSDETLRTSPDRLSVDLDGFVPVSSPTVSTVAGASTVAAAETHLRVGARLEARGERVDALMTLLDLDDGLWVPTLEERARGDHLPGVVVSNEAADDLGVHTGDRIVLRHPRVTGPNSFEYVRSPVRVVALTPLPTRFSAFMDIRDAGLMGLDGVTNTMVVEPKPGVDDARVRRELFQLPGVASVQTVRSFTESVTKAVERSESILYIVAGIVLLLALLIAFNSASINSDERSRDHATMFAFGLPVRRVLSMAVTESAIIGVVSTALGVAGGLVLLDWLINSLFETTFPDLGMVTTLAPRTLVLASLLGVVAVALAPLLGARRIRRMDIPSRLRIVE